MWIETEIKVENNCHSTAATHSAMECSNPPSEEGSYWRGEPGTALRRMYHVLLLKKVTSIRMGKDELTGIVIS